MKTMDRLNNINGRFQKNKMSSKNSENIKKIKNSGTSTPITFEKNLNHKRREMYSSRHR